jgi:hypothetical protein
VINVLANQSRQHQKKQDESILVSFSCKSTTTNQRILGPQKVKLTMGLDSLLFSVRLIDIMVRRGSCSLVMITDDIF